MIVVVGAGKNGRKIRSELFDEITEVKIYDNDRRKWGSLIDGVNVISLEELIDFVEEPDNSIIVGENSPSLIHFIKDLNPACKIFEYKNAGLAELNMSCIEEFKYDNAMELGQKRIKDYIIRMQEYKEEGKQEAYEHAKKFIEFKKQHPQVPEISSIEMTNNCNLACPNCPNSTLSFHKGYINDDVFEAALKYIPPYKNDTVAVHCMGEPLLHPKLFHYLDKMARIGTNICISTNGILLDDNIGDELLRILSCTDNSIMYISFHTKKSVERWYEFARKYDRCPMKNNIHFFGQVLEHNQEDAYKWLNELGISEPDNHPLIRHITSHSWGGNVENRRKEYSNIEINNRIRNCYYLRKRKIAVMWDGSLRGCCYDSNATQKCGSIFDYENADINPRGYDICRFCDPDWITNYQ